MTAREKDPAFAEFLDGMREAFGAEGIDANIKKGMAGLPGFFYYKGPAGEFGTPARPDVFAITARDMVIGPNNLPTKENNADRNRRR